ncbi:MAG: immunoglobulin domain-containing protein, partial [Chitinophagales bacterium]
MKKLIYTLSLVIFTQGLIAQLADVHFYVRTDRMDHFEGGVFGNCWESGNEEYSGYAGFRDDINTAVSWSPCQTCLNNGDCTYGTEVIIGDRVNDAYRIDPYVDGWEDDAGDRCTYDGGAFGDDCRTGPGDRGDILFRELDFPRNNYPTSGDLNGVGAFGNDDFQVYYDIYWVYSGNSIASTINMTCDAQVALQTTGRIRSQSVFLNAGVPYRFQTTSGNDTYLRLYGSDGFTIVAFDDDGGTGQLSLINYTAATTGWHYIETSEFIRDPLTSSVNLEYLINQTPSQPIANDVSVCEGENVTLTATPSAAGTIKWYLTNVSSPEIATGTSFNVGTSLAPGVHYRYVTETSAAGCESTRREVQITVIASPDAPAIADAIVCPGASASLLASNAPGALVNASNFKWYLDNSLSPVVYTGAIYNTPNLTAPPTSYTFYVAGVLNGCVGDTSSAVVTFHQADIPIASNDTSICNGENAILT